ncbi:amino acid deaminase [Brevibacillus laterosporus]|uniref:ACT domain-containing protein n=1 Tax=Brevibacillus laterosporus TaxID=1465 RepID=UPI000CE3BFC7|nr:ACT domain-containing protein [Brevibacillus laterosporus]PPA84772.1 amino acid deaminase [Brevibacillus laterosporus]
MTDYSGLRSLVTLVERFEPNMEQVTLTIMTADDREEIVNLLLTGLREVNPNMQIKMENSTGEYASHVAQLVVGANKYVFSKDYRETYISEINVYACRITADTHGILVYHYDYPGVIHDVSSILAQHEINISKLNVSREQKGKLALLVSLTDEEIPVKANEQIETLSNVTKAISLP